MVAFDITLDAAIHARLALFLGAAAIDNNGI
jgi:hypothetical protein